ncbi:MAG: Tim44 domain-containing protein [Rhodospirillales bacterium]|nr:Tim44 domain-containing protein [Rhodospirillales bacterium]
MTGSGSFPVDIVLFAMVAVFLALRLRSVLGRRQGFEQQPIRQPVPTPGGPVIEGRAEPVPTRPVPDPASPLGQTLLAMGRIDHGFTAQRFLDGAEAAFRMIVTGFAAGDRAALAPLLTPETMAGFEAAIAAREAAGERQLTEIRRVLAIEIVDAALAGSRAQIQIRIVSDQVSHTLGPEGTIVQGTEAVTEITDLWTLERDLAQPDPTWRLAAARSA